MQDIQFKKNRICLLAMLLVLVCIPLFSSFSGFNDISVTQDTPILVSDRKSIPNRGADRDVWLPTVNQNPIADVFVLHTDFSQNAQQLSNRKNNSCMTAFYGLPPNCIINMTPDFISLSAQSPKFNRYLIIPYSSHAPPDILV